MQNTLIQYVCALYCIYGGLIVGFCYDLMSLFTGQSKSIAILSDFVFWCMALIVMYNVLMHAANLDIRAYEFFCFAAGFWLYKVTLGRAFDKIFALFMLTTNKICVFLANMLK